jgi:hypothetical protein
MGMGVAGMIITSNFIDSYCGSFPHSLLSTSKKMESGKQFRVQSRYYEKQPAGKSTNATSTGMWQPHFLFALTALALTCVEM